MGSLSSSSSSSSRDPKSTIIAQVSFAGFDSSATAADLSRALRLIPNSNVWRCRLKSSSTPIDSYPDFTKDYSSISIPNKSTSSTSTDNDDNAWGNARAVVVPHAFVHFVSPEGAKRALDSAGRCELILGSKPLVAHSTSDSPFKLDRRQSTTPFKFSDVGFEIGHLISPTQFLVSWKINLGVDFLIDPFDNYCKVLFSKDVGFVVKGMPVAEVIKCDVKMEFLLRDVMDFRVCKESAPLVLMFQLGLGSAPLIYYRMAADDVYEPSIVNLLDDEDPWIRTTDFTSNGAVGRCNCYRICVKPRQGKKLERALAYMKERRIDGLRPERPIVVRDEPTYKSFDPFFCIQEKEGISFVTLFMVNALVHKGIFNQHSLTDDFFGLLRNNSEVLNDAALRHIYSYKKPVFDAYSRFKLVQSWLLRCPKNIKIQTPSDDNMEVRRLVITPTKAYCIPPESELANRVLRKYRNISDRFLRVTFMDEGMETLNSHVLTFYPAPIVKEVTKNSCPQKTTMHRRVRSVMFDGFNLCGRKYLFLAYSSNQMRDNSAWFFAEDKNMRVKDITSWMGRFENNNVAKYAARMGQCFSSTYATVEVPKRQIDAKLEDIWRNDYCFSDGIGKITPDLAMEVADKLQLSENPPSAYQIRFAGCKGVIAIWPGNGDGIRLSLRSSMIKFKSEHRILEIVSWTKFLPGFLNRQVVTLLSALGVCDDVFERMQDSMVHKLDQMMVDPDIAFEVLRTSCAEQGNVAAMMLSAGFKPQTEPHLKAMLACIRLSQLKELSTKARIFVQKGRWLMGCLDELGVLEQGQCFIQASTLALENCFLKHGSRFSGTKVNKQVIVGTVALSKNPCLHPGDVRILEAVDVPGLHHLVDCLVFPQKGDRPHSHEASGSDLDGDLYFATWDENLIPPSRQSWPPMLYTPAEPKKEPRQIIHKDIADFFVRNISSENLGRICNAHVVHADQSDDGAMDEKCIKLAELAAMAVDFPKTGKMVTMPQHLKVKLYPDFMDKDHAETYMSKKILGRLYRKIKAIPEEDNSSEYISAYEDLPYDTDLEIQEAHDYLADAWDIKCSYDRQLNALLGQFRVDKEGEVVTGHICSKGWSKYNSKKQGDIQERLKNAYYAVQKKYKRIFEDLGSDLNELTDDEKNMMYERKASAWYQVTYHPRWVKKSIELKEPEGELVPPRLSFAWIPADFLVRIKIRCREKGKFGGEKPIDSLANYLSERI